MNLLQNWKTSLAGLLSGLSVLAAAYSKGTLDSTTIATALGLILTGLTAKDSTTHSTVAQVQTATAAATAATTGAKT
jgi:hypothetical protein